MVVIIKIGRKTPRQWARRIAHKAKGLLTFQENIWLIIDRSLIMAKKKCASTPNGGTFLKSNYREIENMHYDIEWIDVKYLGNPDQEEEEYQEAMQMYKSLGQLFKAEFPKDDEFSKRIKTARLTGEQLDKAYSAGYGAAKDQTIADRLLDLGIITFIEKIEEKAPKI